MVTQNVCPHNKFGYCKYQETCKILHVNDVCENSSCDISTCMSRHPKTCKYYRDFGRCKFNCKHIENTVESLKKKNEEMLSKISNIDKALTLLEEKEIKTKTVITRLIYYNVTAIKFISFWLYCHFIFIFLWHPDFDFFLWHPNFVVFEYFI